MTDKVVRANSIKTFVKCPYCDFVNLWYLGTSNTFTQMEVVTCDSDEGGCDCNFILVYRLKIEHHTREIVNAENESLYDFE